MANRKHSRARLADNPSGNHTSAACSDWHRAHADSMMARATIEPNSVAGYTTASTPVTPTLSISLLRCGGVHIRFASLGTFMGDLRELANERLNRFCGSTTHTTECKRGWEQAFGPELIESYLRNDCCICLECRVRFGQSKPEHFYAFISDASGLLRGANPLNHRRISRITI